MSEYEELLQEAFDSGVSIIETGELTRGLRGLYVHHGKSNLIFLDAAMPTPLKISVLGEELGHYHKTSGNTIIGMDVVSAKGERAGHGWAYERLLPLERIIDTYAKGYTTIWGMAEILDLDDGFVLNAICYYHQKHGVLAVVNDWIVQFDPYLSIYKAGE